MLGRLNHVALAVPDLAAASAGIATRWAPRSSAPQALPEHGVTVVFVDVGNTKIELLRAAGGSSPIAAFLEKNPAGGMHHLCYEVDDIIAARDRLQGRGRPHPRRRQSEDRRAWQAGAVPAPQGFFRHAGRAGAGVMGRSMPTLACRIPIEGSRPLGSRYVSALEMSGRRGEREEWGSSSATANDLVLRLRRVLHRLVDGAVRDAAVRAEDAGRCRRRDAGHRLQRAARSAHAEGGDPHDDRFDRAVRRSSTG